ncbi:MAG: hypothetical protein Q9163_003758 [Psora crenata]
MKSLSAKAGLDHASSLRPCDYFDLIAGTSTGGLIAVMLGTLRMDIETCIDEYLKLAPEIFPLEGLIQQSIAGKLFKTVFGRERFEAKPIELAIKGLLKKYLGERSTEGEETLFGFESSKLNEEQSCKVFVCVTSQKLGKPFRFRNYNSLWDVLDDCPIWQACRATTAAPTFFPPVEIGNPPTAYVDGGIGYNNPIRAVIEETSHIWPSARKIGCIVSIGTGVLISRDVGATIKPLFEKLIEMATDTEKVADEFKQEIMYRYGIEQKVYFRFNVDHGLEKVGLEEWREMDRAKLATQAYLKKHWSRVEACSLQIFDPKTPALLASGEDTKSKYHGSKYSRESLVRTDPAENSVLATREEYECLRSLWPSGIDYESQKNQNPTPVLNTCLWTLQNPKYIEWRDNNTKKLLWISAGPGCGKSVLARCIIDEDLRKAYQNNSSKRVIYYFFKDTSPEQRSAARAISTILHQLLSSQPRLIRYALPSYRDIGEALSTTFLRLWSIFTEAATDPLAGDVICVLDALDECDEQERLELIKALEDFCLPHQSLFSASRLKFLLTSRPYFPIRREFDKLLQASENIELAGEDESASIKIEIDLVIKHNVAKLARENRLTGRVSDHLEKRLLKTENRTYLWLRLIWEIIKKDMSGTITEMNEVIDNLPSGIQDSYEALLQRCPNRLFAKKVLQIVLVAWRPLTLEEIDVAMGVNEQTSSYADLELEGSSRLQETLPSRCGLMVSIIDSKVYFIHQTVKEFLLGEVGTKPSVGSIWQPSLDLSESHNLMTEICLRSISFSEVQMDQVNLWNALLPEDYRDMKPNAYYAFLSYSAIYWAEHFRNSKQSFKFMKTIEYFLDTSDRRSVIGRYRINYGTALHTASGGGHKKIVQMLLEKGADVNAEGGHYSNALSAASANGYDKVIQILVDNGADINTQGGLNINALQTASGRGHDKVVQILVDNGADINAQGAHYGNALVAASTHGKNEVIQILLNNGADVEAQSSRYCNALQAASAKGYNKVVQMLLDNGADINAQGEHYGNALLAASTQGKNEVIQILLDNGADVNAPDEFYGNALQAASAGGYDKVVQILLDNGARY